jgi:hypothetical protein
MIKENIGPIKEKKSCDEFVSREDAYFGVLISLYIITVVELVRLFV